MSSLNNNSAAAVRDPVETEGDVHPHCEFPDPNPSTSSGTQKRSKRDQHKCSICSQRIDPIHWQAHYEYELGRLGNVGSDIFRDPLDKNKGKRGAALMAKQHLTTHRKRTVSVYEESLERIQKNRQQRKHRLRAIDAPSAHPEETEPTPLLEDQPVQTCFICNQTLYGDSEAVNLHIDSCLASANEQEPIDETGWEEYEWAGQRRVRATAMMEGGYGGAGFATTTKDEDVDEDLDVEEEDVEYGQSQYTERDIFVTQGEENEDTSALREMVSGGASTRALGSTSLDQGHESPRSGFEETVSDAGWDRHLANESTPASTGSHSRLVIDSLKSRIQQLESATRAVPRCLICLEPYKTPLASIVCWHVHCEQCWLHTLGSKKLCPQCQKITTPADLRRIYF